VDPKTLPAQPVPAAVAKEERERIPLEEIVGLPDFELAAERNMTEKAWAFISAAATDLHCENF
jgi:hypothetical protein